MGIIPEHAFYVKGNMGFGEYFKVSGSRLVEPEIAPEYVLTGLHPFSLARHDHVNAPGFAVTNVGVSPKSRQGRVLSAEKPLVRIAQAAFWSAGHVRQLRGESPLHNLVE
jgi:hypothetical protein